MGRGLSLQQWYWFSLFMLLATKKIIFSSSKHHFTLNPMLQISYDIRFYLRIHRARGVQHVMCAPSRHPLLGPRKQPEHVRRHSFRRWRWGGWGAEENNGSAAVWAAEIPHRWMRNCCERTTNAFWPTNYDITSNVTMHTNAQSLQNSLSTCCPSWWYQSVQRAKGKCDWEWKPSVLLRNSSISVFGEGFGVYSSNVLCISSFIEV